MPLFPATKVAFTGTQVGLTKAQRKSLANVLRDLSPVEFRHGDCVGADAEVHDIIRALLPNCQVIIHPPVDNIKRAFKCGDHELVPKPYLVRNHAMVDKCDQLVAAPKSRHEELRSGTWATIRYARSHGRKIHIVFPSGTTIIEEGVSP